MNNDKSSKSVKAVYDEVRLRVAQQLPAIADAFIEKATGKDASVTHAKFLVDLMLLQSDEVETKSKSVDETAEEEPNRGGPSLTEVLLQTLREMRADPDVQPNATALP